MSKAVIEITEAVAREVGLKVVLLAEHAAAGLPLPFGEGAELVEAAGNGGDKALLSFDVGCDELVDRRADLVRAVRAAEALHRFRRAPSGLNEVVDALFLIFCASVGVIAFPCTAGVGEDKDVLLAVLKCLDIRFNVFWRAFFFYETHFSVFVLARHDAAGASGHFRDLIGPECVKEHFKRSLRHAHFLNLRDERVAHSDGLLVYDRVSVLVRHRAGLLVSLVVRVFLIGIDGEGIVQILEKGALRRKVEVLKLCAFFLRLCKLPVALCLIGVDNLQNAGVACGQFLFHVGNYGRHGHGRKYLVIEALHGTVISGQRPRARLAVILRAGDFERSVNILQGYLPRLTHCIVYLRLHGRKIVHQRVILYTVERDTARLIDAQRLHIAGDELHRCKAAGTDLRNKVVDVVELCSLAPEAESLREGELIDISCRSCGDIDHARIRKHFLQLRASESLCRGLCLAAAALLSEEISHVVRFVERNYAVEVLAEPVDDLLQAVFVCLLRCERVVGGE